MFNYVSITQFDTLKQRWADELRAGCANIDPRITDTLKKFNTLPGVVSVWSCSGHTKAEMIEAKTERFYNNQQARYIIFAATPAAVPVFQAFEHYLRTVDHYDWSITRPELKTYALYWGYDKDPVSGLGIMTTELYPCWELKIRYNNYDEGSAEDVALLHDAVESAWQGLIDFLLVAACTKEPV